MLKDYSLHGEQVLQEVRRAVHETYDNNRVEELNRIDKSYSDKYYGNNQELRIKSLFEAPTSIGKDNSWNFDNVSSKKIMDKEKGFDMLSIKDIAKPDTKLNSLASVAAYKITNKT